MIKFYEMQYSAKKTKDGLELVKKKVPVLYSYTAMEELIQMLTEKGYECLQTNEGTLGIGTWYCIPPQKGDWIYIIEEVYLNSWSSAQTVRRTRKLKLSSR